MCETLGSIPDTAKQRMKKKKTSEEFPASILKLPCKTEQMKEGATEGRWKAVSNQPSAIKF